MGVLLDSKCCLIRCLLCPKSHANNSCNCLRVTMFVKPEFTWLAIRGTFSQREPWCSHKVKLLYNFCKRICLRCSYFLLSSKRAIRIKRSWVDMNRCSPFCRIRLERSRLTYQIWTLVSRFHITHNAGSDDSLTFKNTALHQRRA